MQLLVSVAGLAEAREALRGGADVIDAKDPLRGALGPVSHDRLIAIGAAVGSTRPLSAALGDAADEAGVARATGRAVFAGVSIVKIGFAGVTDEARACALARAARGYGAAVVLVAYADWRCAGSLRPDRIVAVAATAGAAGVLLDTAGKGAPLFALETREGVGAWVAGAHAAGLFAALAGGLSGADFATVRASGADVVGVRGAACVGGRTGRVTADRVAALRASAGPPTRVSVRGVVFPQRHVEMAQVARRDDQMFNAWRERP